MTAFTHRAKRAHYGVNDDKKDYGKYKKTDGKGGKDKDKDKDDEDDEDKDKDKDDDKDVKDKICGVCGRVNWRFHKFCSNCGVRFPVSKLGKSTLVIFLTSDPY
jgi:hypothetical protein